MLIEGIRAKDYATLEGKKFERAIVIIAIGIGIIIRQSDALFIVGVFWGLEGLNKATNYLNEGLYYFTRKEKFIFPMSKAIIEFVLSSILIFDPFLVNINLFVEVVISVIYFALDSALV